MTTYDKSRLVDDMMAFECGDLEEDDTIDMFQYLIDSGLAWSLQGSYGRTARDLIIEGRCRTAWKGGEP
jgi:hypothetical protein